MWICLNDAFVSIVAKRGDPDLLVVRARRRGHLNKLFPGCKPIETAHTDYRYRVLVDRHRAIEAVAERLRKLAYPNFKNSVRDRALHDLYLGFWGAAARFQDSEPAGSKPSRTRAQKRDELFP